MTFFTADGVSKVAANAGASQRSYASWIGMEESWWGTGGALRYGELRWRNQAEVVWAGLQLADGDWRLWVFDTCTSSSYLNLFSISMSQGISKDNVILFHNEILMARTSALFCSGKMQGLPATFLQKNYLSKFTNFPNFFNPVLLACLTGVIRHWRVDYRLRRAKTLCGVICLRLCVRVFARVDDECPIDHGRVKGQLSRHRKEVFRRALWVEMGWRWVGMDSIPSFLFYGYLKIFCFLKHLSSKSTSLGSCLAQVSKLPADRGWTEGNCLFGGAGFWKEKIMSIIRHEINSGLPNSFLLCRDLNQNGSVLEKTDRKGLALCDRQLTTWHLSVRASQMPPQFMLPHTLKI